MAENVAAESLTTEDSVPRQIVMSRSEVSDTEVLQPKLEDRIATTIETIPQQTEGISTICDVTLSEEIATSEALSEAEGISVSTQVNVISEPDAMAPEIGGQTILQTSAHVMGDDSLTHATETVTISQDTIAIASDGLIVGCGEPLHMTASSIPPNLPPWAGRLHDWELIGDSYRGYVTNEVELDLILTLHKQHTNSCWGTRQSPSSAKPSIRLMWKSQYVPYDGVPFLNTGRRATVMECQYGPRRKGCISKKNSDYDEEGIPVKKPHRPTCPARIYIKKVRKFPEFRIDPSLEGKNVRQAQERALTALRLAGVETGGEERFYVQLPLPIAHEYHDTDDIPMTTVNLDNQGQRLHQQIIDKIQEFVARGVTGIYTIKHCLKEYVDKELFGGQVIPPRHNKAYFPTIIDIQNHIHQAQMALVSGNLMPLPPLANLPIIASTINKERVRKRKNPEKLCQTSQTMHRLQTAEAVASIQQVQDVSLQEIPSDDADQTGHTEVSQESIQQERDDLQEQLNKIQESSGQPQQVLITGDMHMPGNKNGQVVIVVTSNNVFNSQPESDTPTTFALTTLPTSQITNIPQSHLGTLTSGNQAVLIAQQGEHGPYLAHTPSENILTVLNPSLHGAAVDEGVVLSMMTGTGQITNPEATHTQPSVPEQLLASQAAVAAILNAAAGTVVGTSESKPDQSQVSSRGEDEEPQAKRQAVGLDLSSLVKEAVYDPQQMAEVGMSHAHVIQRHMTTAQLTAALQAQSNATINTVPIAYQSTENGKEDNQVVTMEIQQLPGTGRGSAPESSTAGILEGGYQVVDISAASTPQLSQSSIDVRDLETVTMTTAQLMATFSMPKFAKPATTEPMTSSMTHAQFSRSSLQSQAINNGSSEISELRLNIGQAETESDKAVHVDPFQSGADNQETTVDGSMERELNYSPAQASNRMEAAEADENFNE